MTRHQLHRIEDGLGRRVSRPRRNGACLAPAGCHLAFGRQRNRAMCGRHAVEAIAGGLETSSGTRTCQRDDEVRRPNS
jgi:hypothetical protein